MQRYLPAVDVWQGKHLVTLTLRNVPAPELPATIKNMIRDFQAVKLGMRRTDRIKLVALRKLECTYNAKTDEYHPHFHIVVQGEAAARLLLKRWLERHPDTADAKGQDVRSCDSDSLKEVFKYFTKLLAKTRTNSSEEKRSAPVPPAAIDVIFRSMKGHRVYQPVGFKVAAEVPDEAAEEIAPVEATAATTRLGERVTWEWSQAATDWVDATTGECLTGYQPAEKFRKLVEQIAAPRAQLETFRTVRPLDPQMTGEMPTDTETSRAEMRRRMESLERNRNSEPYSEEFVSKTLQAIWDLSAERAKEIAAYVAPAPDTQLGFFPPGPPPPDRARRRLKRINYED